MKEQQRRIARTLMAHIAFWTLLCAAGAFGSYTDRIELDNPAASLRTGRVGGHFLAGISLPPALQD